MFLGKEKDLKGCLRVVFQLRSWPHLSKWELESLELLFAWTRLHSPLEYSGSKGLVIGCKVIFSLSLYAIVSCLFCWKLKVKLFRSDFLADGSGVCICSRASCPSQSSKWTPAFDFLSPSPTHPQLLQSGQWRAALQMKPWTLETSTFSHHLSHNTLPFLTVTPSLWETYCCLPQLQLGSSWEQPDHKQWDRNSELLSCFISPESLFQSTSFIPAQAIKLFPNPLFQELEN